MKGYSIAFALLATSIGAQAADGAFNNPDEAIEYRKAAFNLIKENFADMGDMIKDKKPMDEAEFATRAQHLFALSSVPFTAFTVKDSNQGSTNALANVWNDASQFDLYAEEFQFATADLAQAATLKDHGNIKQAFGAVAKTCKGCHDEFKAD